MIKGNYRRRDKSFIYWESKRLWY